MSADRIVAAFIGKRYEAGARGPDAFDCWGLVLALRAALDLPVPPDFAALAPRERLAVRAPHGCWSQAGAIAYSERLAHAGLVWHGHVVHTVHRAGVVAWTLARWRQHFPDARCYEWSDEWPMSSS